MKNIWVAYALWFFLGPFGVHRFYCNKTGTGLLWLFTLGLFFIGWFIDLFLIPGMVYQANMELAAMTQRGGNQIQHVNVVMHAPAAGTSEKPAKATRDCPHCAEEINAKANVCRFCHNKVEPVGGSTAVGGADGA